NEHIFLPAQFIHSLNIALVQNPWAAEAATMSFTSCRSSSRVMSLSPHPSGSYFRVQIVHILFTVAVTSVKVMLSAVSCTVTPILESADTVGVTSVTVIESAVTEIVTLVSVVTLGAISVTV